MNTAFEIASRIEPSLGASAWSCVARAATTNVRHPDASILPSEFNPATRLSGPLAYHPPARRTESKPLPTIPVEVYLVIFDHLKASYEYKTDSEYKTLLSTLCLVCRMFCEELQHMLFANLTHNESDPSSRLRTLYSHRAWQQVVEAQDPRAHRLANFVRGYTLLPGKNSGYQNGGILVSFPRIVLQMRSLENLTVTDCIVPAEAFAAFAYMPHLRSVTLEGCQLASPPASTVRPEVGTWTSLTATRVDGLTLWIRTLAQFVDTEKLDHLFTDNWGLISALLSHHAPNLASLGINTLSHDTDPTELLAFLSNAPELTSLTISSDQWDLTAPLPPSTIPHLHTLAAPHSLAPHIVPGRPIHSLELLWPARILRTPAAAPHTIPPAAIRDSTAPLTTLTIPGRCVPWLAGAAPAALRTLVLRPLCARRAGLANPWRGPRWEPFSCGHVPLQHVLGPTTIVYALEHACCDNCGTLALALGRQRTCFGYDAAARFPDATVIRFGKAVEWVRDAEGEWAPRVVSREVVRGALLRAPEKGAERAVRKGIEDVDGCLRAVLEEEELTPDVRARLALIL